MTLIANSKTLSDAVTHISSVDPVLAAVITRSSAPTITPHKNYYQELVESIVSQQLSVKAAATIFKRFLDLFPSSTFPTPEQLRTVDADTLRSVGLSRQKASYIQDLAAKVIDGSVRFDHLDGLSNDDVIYELTQIKGIGVWTVHMFLIFCMGRLDVLPVGDLGIKNGIHKLYDLSEKPDADTMIAIAKEHHWSPYESVASWYIWRSLNNTPSDVR